MVSTETKINTNKYLKHTPKHLMDGVEHKEKHLMMSRSRTSRHFESAHLSDQNTRTIFPVFSCLVIDVSSVVTPAE